RGQGLRRRARSPTSGPAAGRESALASSWPPWLEEGHREVQPRGAPGLARVVGHAAVQLECQREMPALDHLVTEGAARAEAVSTAEVGAAGLPGHEAQAQGAAEVRARAVVVLEPERPHVLLQPRVLVRGRIDAARADAGEPELKRVVRRDAQAHAK